MNIDRPRAKIGLALGSGIARGWAHIGVLRAMERFGLKPDIVCGTSIGALVGAAHLTGSLDPLEEWARGLTRINFLRYLDLRLSGGGIFNGRRFETLLRNNFQDQSIENLSRPFASVATDLASGHEIWLQQGNLVRALQASYALPGVFSPVQVDGRWLVDGALVNPLPVSVCRALGAQLVIAVNLHTDMFGKIHSREALLGIDDNEPLETGGAFKSWRLKNRPREIMMRQLFGHSKNAPSMFSVMVASLNIIQDRLSRSRMAGDPPDVMIAPRLGHIGLLEFDRADEIIEEGKHAFALAEPLLQDALAAVG